MSFLFLMLFEVFLGGGLSLDGVKLSEGIIASIAALRVGQGVEDTKEKPFTVVVLFEWVDDDIDYSEFIICREGDVIHSAVSSARVRLVFGLGFHNLAKHELIR